MHFDESLDFVDSDNTAKWALSTTIFHYFQKALVVFGINKTYGNKHREPKQTKCENDGEFL